MAKITEVFADENRIEERNLTKAESDALDAANAAYHAAKEAEETARVAAKQAVLNKLGLTAEELAAALA